MYNWRAIGCQLGWPVLAHDDGCTLIYWLMMRETNPAPPAGFFCGGANYQNKNFCHSCAGRSGAMKFLRPYPCLRRDDKGGARDDKGAGMTKVVAGGDKRITKTIFEKNCHPELDSGSRCMRIRAQIIKHPWPGSWGRAPGWQNTFVFCFGG